MESNAKPAWIEKIQANSWEPELFFSGGILFTLLQIPDLLKKYSMLMLQESGYFEPVYIAHIVAIGINGLIVGFFAHLFLRGIWLGALCFNFAFPQGIDEEKLTCEPRFKRHILSSPDSVKLIIELEKYSSLTFAASFIFFLIAIGVLATLMLLIPHQGLKESIGETGFLIVFAGAVCLQLLGLVYFIDFLSLGWVKKQKKIAKLYYPVYRLFSLLTLSFLYKNAYHTLATRIKPWKIWLGMALGMGLAVFITDFKTFFSLEKADTRYFLQGMPTELKSHYEDQRPDDELILNACIPSEKQSGKLMRLFVVSYKSHEKYIKKRCPGDQAKSLQEKMACLNAFYQVYLNDRLVESLDWQAFKHPKTGEIGLKCFVPVSPEEHRKQTLSIRLAINESDAKSPHAQKHQIKKNYAEIPFWVE